MCVRACVQVSVAKNFDAPIKLLFPRLGEVEGGKRPFAMLGLGDIVIPGIFVALVLRYDVSRNFKTSYFQSAFGGYVLGLTTTILVMNYFQVRERESAPEQATRGSWAMN